MKTVRVTVDHVDIKNTLEGHQIDRRRSQIKRYMVQSRGFVSEWKWDEYKVFTLDEVEQNLSKSLKDWYRDRMGDVDPHSKRFFEDLNLKIHFRLECE